MQQFSVGRRRATRSPTSRPGPSASSRRPRSASTRPSSALLRQMAELEKQLQALRLEKEKLEEVEAERERGTAKGRTFEEAVAEAVDAIALAQGDVAEAVGDLKEATGKVGDVVVAIDACNGPARGRIVIEAKDSRLSRPKALERARPGDGRAQRRLRRARRAHGGRGAGQAASRCASTTATSWSSRSTRRPGSLPLELGYRLARARVLMKRSDARRHRRRARCATPCERALAALAEERKVKHQLTGAKTEHRQGVRRSSRRWPRACAACSQEIDALVRPAGRGPTPAAGRDDQLGALGQQQVVVRVRALLADLEHRRRDLLRDRLLGAGAHLVAARLERLLDRGGVAGLDRARALARSTRPRA